MASATGVPQHPPHEDDVVRHERSESEPLLGRPGDAAQPERGSILRNLILGESVAVELEGL